MSSSAPAKIAILQYSTYGHIATLAKQVEEGVKETGATVEVFQINETLSDEILGKMHANKAPIKDLPIITPAKLKEVSITSKYGFERETRGIGCSLLTSNESPLSHFSTFPSLNLSSTVSC